MIGFEYYICVGVGEVTWESADEHLIKEVSKYETLSNFSDSTSEDSLRDGEALMIARLYNKSEPYIIRRTGCERYSSASSDISVALDFLYNDININNNSDADSSSEPTKKPSESTCHQLYLFFCEQSIITCKYCCAKYIRNFQCKCKK